MAPYSFDGPDADTILRSSDGKEFHVHRIILGLSSPIFQAMFALPQPTKSSPQAPVAVLSSQIPTIDVSDTSDVLQPFIQYLYPRPPPEIADISAWAALYAVADKYNAEVVMVHLKGILVSKFLDTSPFRVYALASHWGLTEEAKLASKKTLMFDILDDLPLEDANLMGGSACMQLFSLHLKRREVGRTLITNHPLPFPSGPCSCPPPDYSCLVPALCQRMATRPWLAAEELHEEVAKWDYPTKCSDVCRNAVKNMHVYFSSLLEKIGDLPQTV